VRCSETLRTWKKTFQAIDVHVRLVKWIYAGILQVLIEDDKHLKDFEEYMS